MHHSEVLDRLEFVIINNHPDSTHGKALYDLRGWVKEPLTYVEFSAYSSTALRDKIFSLANTEYVLVMDCHVLLETGAIEKLLNFYDNRLDDGNLLQGPLLYDDLRSVSTHFNLDTWGGDMWGAWDVDPRGEN